MPYEVTTHVFFLFNSLIHTEGHSGINLIPLDPLDITALNIKQGAESPVNVELKFKNVKLHGLSSFELTKVRWGTTEAEIPYLYESTEQYYMYNQYHLLPMNRSGFKKDLRGKYQLKGKGPALYLAGPYEISGRVLILPIQGVGDQNITLCKY